MQYKSINNYLVVARRFACNTYTLHVRGTVTARVTHVYPAFVCTGGCAYALSPSSGNQACKVKTKQSKLELTCADAVIGSNSTTSHSEKISYFTNRLAFNFNLYTSPSSSDDERGFFRKIKIHFSGSGGEDGTERQEVQR